jgi:XRE family aerobic/anaerobic benzoate catabolism transcriptional regulator
VLTALGERTRALRHRRGLTRKALSAAAGVSERHLANLEYGVGNASILVLRQVAEALGCPLSDLLDEGPAASPEWALIRSLLAGRDDAVLRRARAAVEQALTAESPAAAPGPRPRRVALVGLRGAGKSTLGRLLGEDLGVPFVELSREIERLAGCTIGEIQALYGLDGYRRHERRALEAAIEGHDEAVIAVPGGLVSDPATFRLLLARCTTVWLRAAPEDHMRRVAAQGDLRPMAASDEAMEDLRAILAARAAFYSRAEFELDTSAAPLPATFERLRHLVRGALGLPA